ncbi:MAG: hypothetical protein QMC80_05680 [Thermoplasmatales archaeon]|nr:hypothetical protein [Thermoplasmatales archaeon]
MSKNRERLLSIGVFITLTISFVFMFYFFITSIFAVSINPIIDPQIWWDNRYMYTACLLISSVIYIAPLLLQYLLVRDKRLPKKRTFFREYITIPNTLFIILVVSFIMLSLVAWYRSGSVPITGPTGHGGADVRYFRNALFSRVTDLIIPITLTVIGIILSIAQYFQLRSSHAKNKPITSK